MDDKWIIGLIVFVGLILYMLYHIKKDGNMPSFVIGWVLLIMAFISFEVDYGFLYVLGFITRNIPYFIRFSPLHFLL